MVRREGSAGEPSSPCAPHPPRRGACSRTPLVAALPLVTRYSLVTPPQVRSRIRPVPEDIGNQGLRGLSAYRVASIRGQTEQSPTTSPTKERPPDADPTPIVSDCDDLRDLPSQELWNRRPPRCASLPPSYGKTATSGGRSTGFFDLGTTGSCVAGRDPRYLWSGCHGRADVGVGRAVVSTQHSQPG